jgi:hypothetical protein
VDNSGTANGYLSDAKSSEDKFEEECRKYNGTVIMA